MPDASTIGAPRTAYPAKRYPSQFPSQLADFPMIVHQPSLYAGRISFVPPHPASKTLCDTVTMEIRFADAADLLTITRLINQAFSVEFFFKAGDRITLEEVQRLFERGGFMLLEDNEIQGCVYVELRG